MSSQEFGGVIGRYADESTPWWPEPRRAPAGAPNVVFVLLDDVGFAQLGCFGSDLETPTFDALAESGLRFRNFHTTALCSPTRSCLNTGRNHHSNGMARVIEIATGFPGYNAHIPKANGFLSEMLLPHGYATYAVGKWHLTPEDECHAGASRERWPLGRGFERFYGFMSGETHQFVPNLVSDNHLVRPPAGIDDGYHLTTDLVDHAIDFVKDLRVVDDQKPFFLYFCTGACHSPHQAPAEWIERYRGRFDGGWDEWRERALARQKALGIMPEGAELSPRPEWVPAWDSLSADQRRLYARYMEAFAGFLSHTDHEIGRLVEFLRRTGDLDNTLLFVMSDNGASSEGGVEGSQNDLRLWNGVSITLEEALAHIDQIGGPHLHNNYPWGWTVAGNTPFRRWKREVHEGGVADPLIVHCPGSLAAPPGVRSQYVHVIDLVPTVLETLGLEPPQEIGGVTQSPIEGSSFARALTDPAAPEHHQTQYYEMFGCRALYHEGWKAVTYHPMMVTEPGFDDDAWELYHVAKDLSECHDLAAEHPDRLRELVDRWWIEAGRYPVLPLDNRPMPAFSVERPLSVPPRPRYVYYPGAAQVPEVVAPNVKNRSHAVSAHVRLGEATAQGVLLAQGSGLGGWCLFVQDGHLVYVHNLAGVRTDEVRAEAPLGPGAHVLGFRFEPTGQHQGDVVLTVDGAAVGRGHLERFTPGRFSLTGAGVTCGYSNGLPVTRSFVPPFGFTGDIDRVVLEVDGVPSVDHQEEVRAALISQ